jgi:hypothetical protein
LKNGYLENFLPNKENVLIWLNLLVMMIGLFFLNWQPAIIIFAYVFETIIIGIIHIVKLWTVTRYGSKQMEIKVSGKNRLSGIGIIPFFIFHYFFFILIQSIFIFSFMAKAVPGISDDGFHVFKNYRFLFSQTDMIMAFVAIGLANIGYTMRNFFIPKRYHDFTSMQLLLQPYPRIIVQQFLSILPGFFFLFIDSGVVIVLVLMIARTALDLYLCALKYNAALRESLINKINQNGKLKNILLTEQQINLFLE